MLIIILIIFAIFTLGLLFVITSTFLGFLITRVPYVRSNRKDTELVLSHVPMTQADVFYDLGSGDGRVVFMAEKMYGVSGVGYERTLWTHLHALLKRWYKKSSAKFHKKDFFKDSWSGATVVYCYLYPPLMRSVEEKFLNECKPGAVFISRDFPFPTMKPAQIVDFAPPHNAYIYRKP